MTDPEPSASAASSRVLVAGGGGFIGRHVSELFDAVGCEVSILDIAAKPEDIAFEWITGTVTDPTLLASSVAGRDTVVFLANASLPESSLANLALEVEAHVRDTVRAAEICAALNVRRFLFASSGGTVYGQSPEPGKGLREDMLTRPRNAYGVSKLAIEHYLRLLSAKTGMRAVSLRIANPYGEGQRAVRGQGFVAAAMQHAMDATPMELWGDGSVERDFIHVSDVARAFVAAASTETPPDVVNIGSGRSISLREMLTRVEEACGQKIDLKLKSERGIDVPRNLLDGTLAARTLGWVPQVDLKDGLARTAAWWVKTHATTGRAGKTTKVSIGEANR